MSIVTALPPVPVALGHTHLRATHSLPYDGGLDKTPAGPHVHTASKILAIIERYRLLQPSQDDIPARGHTKFLQLVASKVSNGQPIQMCLPAFPFKSPNSVDKVLGRLPDKGEEFALAHMNGMCAAIGGIYEPGALLTIISDGLVYNDILSVPDRDVWAYGTALRSMSAEEEFKHINFARLQDLVHVENLPEELDESVYVENASNFRDTLLSRFGDAELDMSSRIHDDDDTCMTYRGYIRFLCTDLLHVYPIGPDRTKSQYKKTIEKIAKRMLMRGDAFAHAVKERFIDQLRLSIHPSTFVNKISVNLLPTDTIFTTPWHCSIGFRLDGTATTGPREQFEKDDAWELVYEDGRPSFFRERSEMYSGFIKGDSDGQSSRVSFSPMYPSGLMIRSTDGSEIPLTDVDSQKLRGLTQNNSPVVLRGFRETMDRERFVAKAHDLGVPTPWKFGLVLEVKDRGDESRGLNNVLSAEWMPWHYDGIFKMTKHTDADGKEVEVSTPPRFMMFTSITTSPKDTGFTLFASSSLMIQNLPRSLPLEALRPLKWTVRTGAFDELKLHGLPLVVDHPATGRPCVRFHEPWPQAKTKFSPTSVTVEDGATGGAHGDSGRICEALTELLHDRRVAYYHSWEKGDVVVNDNILAMHTRSDFTAGCDRELWRIHFD
ncbi:putative pyoverdine/dityrosine biosynthesis protein [Hypoxylon sp. FL1284]|nr:putative pyoverdine/dityrosine biosynthesis protein [Hypoxylon sp. FL1284]